MKSRKTDGRKKDENYTGRNGDGESRYADPGRLSALEQAQRMIGARRLLERCRRILAGCAWKPLAPAGNPAAD